MSASERPFDAEIQAFIEGRLDARGRSAMRARLRGRPALAAEVEAMRCQHEALRTIGREVLYEPVPPRLRRILRQGAAPRDGGHADSSARRVRCFELTLVTATILAGCGGGPLAF